MTGFCSACCRSSWSRDRGKGRGDAGRRHAYGDLVRHLHILGRPDLLHFDDGAQAIRRALEQKHLELMALETINRKLAAHIGKYDGMFARLCVIWHCIEHADKGYQPT